MMSGRVQARAPETGVRIGLGARDPEHSSPSLEARRSCRPACGPRCSRTTRPTGSRRRPGRGCRRPPRTRRIGNRPPRTRRRSRRGRRGHRPRGWPPPRHRRRSAPDGSSASGHPPPRRTARAPPRTPTSPGTARRLPRIGRSAEDDGENPLPPALEPEEPGPSRPARRVGSAAIGRDDVRSASMQRACTSPPGEPLPRMRSLSSADRDSRSYGSAPRPIPEDALPPSTGIAPASSRETEDGPPARRRRAARRPPNVRRGPRPPAAASRPRDGDPASPADSSETDESSEDNPPPPRSTRRPTWRELSISPDNVPVDEALRRSSGEEIEDGDRAP